jgi:SNF2 family DNA or RNA helicase
MAGTVTITPEAILLSAPYNPSLVESIKRLPPGDRRWDPEKRMWVIAPNHVDVVKAIAERFEMRVVNHEGASYDVPCIETSYGTVRFALSDGQVYIIGSRPAVESLRIPSLLSARWDSVGKRWVLPAWGGYLAFIAERARSMGWRPSHSLLQIVEQARRRDAEMRALSESTGGEVAEWARSRLNGSLITEAAYPYQLASLKFIEANGGRVIIGDEMGLGKTLEALIFASAHRGDISRLIVICPAMVKAHWAHEITKWLNEKPYNIGVVSSQVLRTAPGYTQLTQPAEMPVLVINYEQVVKHVEALERLAAGSCVVIDECHYIKNWKAQRTKAVIRVAKKAKYILALSGTPIVNRPEEFFTTLNLLRPDVFPYWKRYNFRYCMTRVHLNELGRLVRETGIVIRRRKDDVLQSLPPKRYLTLEVDIDESEVEEEAMRLVEMVQSTEGTSFLETAPLIAQLSRYRHALGIARARAVKEWIREFLQQNPDRKLVIFCHHRKVARLLSPAVITGDMSPEERAALVMRFQNDPDFRLLAATFGAAGVGISLTAAQDVLLAERSWVPSQEDQAVDRLHRIGQKSSVAVWVCQSQHWLDRRIARVLEEKRKVITTVLDEGKVERSVVLDIITSILKEGQ